MNPNTSKSTYKKKIRLAKLELLTGLYFTDRSALVYNCQELLVIKNYYKILKVESSATKDDIRISYRKMALKYHPDISRNKLSENKFKEITEAYHTLIDDSKRKIYDQKLLLNAISANSIRLVCIYIFVLAVVISFVLWYLSHLSV